MADVALSSNTWSKILPKIKQYEATTGRQISSEALEALFKADIDEAYDRSYQNQQLGIEQERLDLDKEAAKDAESAAKTSGAIQLGGTALQAGMLYKSLFPSTPAIKGSIGSTALTTGTTSALTSTATAAEMATGVNLPGTATVTTAGITPTSLLSTIAPAAGVGAIGGLAGNLYTKWKSDSTDDPANVSRRGKWAGAAGGAVAGFAVGGPVGAVVGGIAGALSGGK